MALDLEKYRKNLLDERDQTARDLGNIMENTGPTTDDRQLTAANAPVVAEIKDVEASVKDMRSDRLEKINAALQAIDDGTYGTCTTCGKQIDPRRLDAEPSALTCMECLPEEEANFTAPQL
jgi:RNA polymerase-binding transcription factor DksA